MMPDRSDPGVEEDLPRLAAWSFELSKRLCRSCGQLHALWPYIRLARASTGVEAAASHLQSLLAARIAAGRRRVLIAGAADTGLPALVHGTLHFIAAGHRAGVLARLRRALAPGGCLMLLFNTGRPIDGALTAEGRDGYADWVLDELDRLAVPLPEERAAFRARL